VSPTKGRLAGLAGAALGTLLGCAARGGTTRSGSDWGRALGEDVLAAGLPWRWFARRGAWAGFELVTPARASDRERLSLHGLRAGFITGAYKAGTRNGAIMAHTRHMDSRAGLAGP
jgi:hypothetical protein